jgi:hypothetical protein
VLFNSKDGQPLSILDALWNLLAVLIAPLRVDKWDTGERENSSVDAFAGVDELSNASIFDLLSLLILSTGIVYGEHYLLQKYVFR